MERGGKQKKKDGRENFLLKEYKLKKKKLFSVEIKNFFSFENLMFYEQFPTVQLRQKLSNFFHPSEGNTGSSLTREWPKIGGHCDSPAKPTICFVLSKASPQWNPPWTLVQPEHVT